MTNLCVLKPAVARRHLSVAPLLGILLAAASANAANGLVRVSSGLGGAVQVTHAPNAPDRLVGVQKAKNGGLRSCT